MYHSTRSDRPASNGRFETTSSVGIGSGLDQEQSPNPSMEDGVIVYTCVLDIMDERNLGLDFPHYYVNSLRRSLWADDSIFLNKLFEHLKKYRGKGLRKMIALFAREEFSEWDLDGKGFLTKKDLQALAKYAPLIEQYIFQAIIRDFSRIKGCFAKATNTPWRRKPGITVGDLLFYN